MDKRSQKYICPTCANSKTLHAKDEETDEEFQANLPSDLPCNNHGCKDRCTKQRYIEHQQTPQEGDIWMNL